MTCRVTTLARTGREILLSSFLLLATTSWGEVFVHWTSPEMPSAKDFGFSDLVISWDGGQPLLDEARKRGYHVYLEVPIQQAEEAAVMAEKGGAAGIILKVAQSERSKAEASLPGLRSGHPKLRFLVLNPDGKEPEMRGSLVIKRDSVLEVSSPTAQPWIDTNLALVRVEQRAEREQAPLYSFAWNTPESGQQQKMFVAADYLLGVAEAGAFHADLVLEVPDRLQKRLSERDAEAWALWKQVRSSAAFYSHVETRGLEAAANLAVVVEDFDPGDEVMNLLARHNIPFEVLLAADLNTKALESFDVVAVLAKPDKAACEKLTEAASRGKTVVVVDAHGPYPWHQGQPIPVNEHVVSYSVGSGKVLELSEPVTDPETFAQDIRRLIGKQNSLISLWNGLTTIAAPYREPGGGVKEVEFVNYAGDPVRVQVQIKGSFSSVRYESPEHGCCRLLQAVQHDGFTEFVIPDLMIAGRVHLEQGQQPASASHK